MDSAAAAGFAVASRLADSAAARFAVVVAQSAAAAQFVVVAGLAAAVAVRGGRR